MTARTDTDAIALAERILVLVDEGLRTTTYKLAVLAALMDLCLEKSGAHGEPPDTITTRELAEKVIALYWPQAVPAQDLGLSGVLLQSTNVDRQASIVTAIASLREELTLEPRASPARARAAAPEAWARLLDRVEWTLIEMPLPKLQRIGGVRDELLYEIAWDDEDAAPRRADVVAYQRGRPSPFDNRIRLRRGVGDALARLHGLLRPILQTKWARMVADVNELEEAKLQEFLFGARRVSLDAVRAPLLELHDGACFYCARKIEARSLAIDHFVPWSRHAENAVENLVPAHERCNLKKLDFLAAREHVRAWSVRNGTRGKDLALIAERGRFESAPARVTSVARSIYVRLPAGARLWVRGGQFEPVGTDPIAPLFDQSA